MAQVIITIKVMPETPEVDLEVVLEKSRKKIEAFGSKLGKSEIEPIAFGLKALKLIFVSDEEKGGTEGLESELASIEGVQSAETIDVRRAIG